MNNYFLIQMCGMKYEMKHNFLKYVAMSRQKEETQSRNYGMPCSFRIEFLIVAFLHRLVMQ